MMERAKAEAYIGEQKTAKMDRDLQKQMAQGEANLEKWTQEREYKMTGGHHNGADIARKIENDAIKKADADRSDFLTKLDQKTSVYRKNGEKVDGHLLDDENIVPPSMLPHDDVHP